MPKTARRRSSKRQREWPGALTTLIAARIADLAHLLNICLHLERRRRLLRYARTMPAATTPGKDDRCLSYFGVAAARCVRERENAPANASGSVGARAHMCARSRLFAQCC
ncbi:hypothetical protein MRX96_030889 [Rhipicephalus microplus]